MTQRLLAGGFVGVVAKPLEPATLIAALARAIDDAQEGWMEDQADAG